MGKHKQIDKVAFANVANDPIFKQVQKTLETCRV
jgi:hypothetical protein